MKTVKHPIYRLCILVLSLLCLQSSAMWSNTIDFKDMPSDWSTEALEKAVDFGWLTGYEDQIMPKAHLTRAQMATVMNRIFGAELKANLITYKDVPQSAWYYEAMQRAVSMKTFLGSDGYLRPEMPITRQEAFVVVARAFSLEATTLKNLNVYQDGHTVAPWAKEGVLALVEAGWIQGSDGKLNPTALITRAEFAQLLSNKIGHTIHSPGVYSNQYEGHVVVTTPDVTFKNAVINGDLVLGDGVGAGDVFLDNTQVNGRLLVRGGGVNSIYLQRSRILGSLIVAKINGPIRLVADQHSSQKEVFIKSEDDVVLEGYFSAVKVLSKGIKVMLSKATIDTIWVVGQGVTLEVDASSQIDQITTDGTATQFTGDYFNAPEPEPLIQPAPSPGPAPAPAPAPSAPPPSTPPVQPPPPVINKTLLESRILQGTQLLEAVVIAENGEAVYTTVQFTSQDTYNTFEAAVLEAQTVLALTSVTQSTIDAAATTLLAEENAFKSQLMYGSRKAIPLMTQPVTASVIEMGALLSESVLTGVFRHPVTNTLIEGQLFFNAPDVLVIEAVTEHVWHFQPVSLEHYQLVTGIVTVTAVETNYTPLTAAIDAANQKRDGVVISLDGSDIQPEVQWVTTAVDEAYSLWIDAAEAVLSDLLARQAQVDQATEDLEVAGGVFDAALDFGTLVPPSGLMAQALDKSIRLHLEANEAVDGYEVTMAVYPNTTYEVVAHTVQTEGLLIKELTPGVRYTFKISSIRRGQLSALSSPVSAIANVDDQGMVFLGNRLIISHENTNYLQTASTGALPTNLNGVMMQMDEDAFDLEPYQIYPEIPIIEGDHLVTQQQEMIFLSEDIVKVEIGSVKSFNTVNFQTSPLTYEITKGRLLYIGNKVEVWVEHENPTVVITSEQAALIGQEFDANMFNLVTSNFYEAPDVNDDGRIAIFLYDIKDQFNIVGSGAYVGGYFNGNDLLVTSPASNKMDIFYVDTYPAMGLNVAEPDITKVYSTLVHEFQHMVNFNRNRLVSGFTTNMDTWLNEALSMAAEHLYLKGPLTSRINTYNNSSVIRNGRSLLQWGNDGVLADYALSYLFGMYLWHQMEQALEEGHEVKVFRKIIESEHLDYRAVEAVIQTHMDSDLTFERFMTYFRAATVLKAQTGYFGFGGDSAFNGLNTQSYTGNEILLEGGGAVVITLQEAFAPINNGLDIKFIGLFLPE